ncbi:DUF6497 family protein [Tropicimonas isoalkanivorans]|uniref:Acetolactate synthase n=1 Tax=Tropicimonas isoalkanivorans TaxID=441112 RepID=A0A1I1JH06_9RHOB|nr:DUF6497 family protein [Tropicimonas isoalkanivorans]SFC47242.1 hypothetical protein SAMN04488094_10599 [Tropicimonas isoalkanivorans]
MRLFQLVGAVGLALGAQPVAAQEIVLHSGLSVMPLDRIVERQADGRMWLTLRYVTPRIARDGGDMGYEDVATDLDELCNTQGLSAAAEEGGIDEVVIALLDRPVEWGTTDPDATMFIGAYFPDEEGCIWQ